MLPLGKVPIRILDGLVLSKLSPGEEVVVKPSVGLDFSAIRVGDEYLIVSSDPVTGAYRRVGWYAVNVGCNDVSTSGSRPRYVENVILLPEGAGEPLLEELVGDMVKAAESLGVSIVGGHTEVTKGLDRPIVIVTAMTFAKEFVTASGCRPGDRIFMTKSAGLEGTSILSELVEGSPAEGFEESLSVVEEAVASFSTGLVHAMHDPTEGGILGGVYEMSLASNLGFTLYEDRVPVAEKTSELCSTLGIDPLKLISSGSLLISVGREDEKEFEREMEAHGFDVSCIGEFTEGPRVLKRRDGRAEVVGEVVDELWRVLSSPKLKY